MANPLFDALFGRHQGSDAVFLHLADGVQITHAQFLATTARFANQLTDLGIGPGDRVAAQIAKSRQALSLYAACVQAGIVFLPLNTAYTADEVSYFVGNSGAKLLICDGKDAEALGPVATETGAALESLNADGSGSFPYKAAYQRDSFDTVPR